MTVLIVQRYTADRLRGRAFTVIISAHNMLLGIAMIAAGALTEVAGARWTYVVAAALLGGRRLRRARALTRHHCRGRSGPPAGRVASAVVAGRRDWTRETLASRRPRRRPPRARPRDHARRERRPARVRGRLRPLPGDRPCARSRAHRPARRRQVDARLVARPARAAARREGRRHLRRPVEPVHARGAARRPHPPDRPLPRPRRVHPLDGHARPPRRAVGDDAAGAARARRRRQGRRLPRDGRHRARARSACSRSPTPSCSR